MYVFSNFSNYKFKFINLYDLQIYCWEGAHSNCADRETTLNEACRMAKEYSAQLVKASQGWEPSHLLQMYNGKLRILTGEHRDKR